MAELPSLEIPAQDGSTRDSLRAELATLTAQRDELLKAGKAAWHALQSLLVMREGMTDEALRGVAVALDAAITKAAR